MPEINLPHNWQPRDYQQPLIDYLYNGGKRALITWHRRAGKDTVSLHWTAVAAHTRVGNYWHMLPKYNQCRKAVWEARNPHTGKRWLDEAFPEHVCKRRLDNQMFIEFHNGSTWQLMGSDDPDALVGSPPLGIVFSEFSLTNPSTWSYLRPILQENGGWALFVTTPRGMDNHAAQFYFGHRDDSEWFCEVLPADKTGVFSPDQLQTEKKELITEYGEIFGTGIFNQEYMCSWQSAIPESYYGREMELADEQGRICDLPYDKKLPVFTSWDIGHDGTAIWFIQQSGTQVWAIDYYENSDVGFDHYAKIIKEKPYVYSEHVFPHDAGHREFVSGRGMTRIEQLESYDIFGRVLPQHKIPDGINSVRMILPNMYFDKAKTKRGVSCLRNYRREWDDSKKVFRDNPVHDQYSHGADALRYYAMGDVRVMERKPIAYKRRGLV